MDGYRNNTLTIAAAVGVFAILAASPVAAQTYRACYVPNTGVVYRIGTDDTAEACRSNRHVEFSWTDASAVGVTGYEIVEAEGPCSFAGNPALGHQCQATAWCPVGKVAIRGGFDSGPNTQSSTYTYQWSTKIDRPRFDAATNRYGWQFVVQYQQNQEDGTLGGLFPEFRGPFTGYAVCVTGGA